MPYRPDRALVTLDEARRIAGSIGTPVTRTEEVPLAEAAGRVLAVPVVATHNVPPFARAVMDGYAVVAADLAAGGSGQPVRLQVTDTIFAGRAPSRPVLRGACAAIATGAPIPPGADAVVMVEHTTRDGDVVVFAEPASAGQHITPAGSDIPAGAVALEPGTPLTPARLGVVAALGLSRVEVFVRPRVAILVTGDEVAPPGTPLRPGQIHDVNTTTLAAVVAAHGGQPDALPMASDDEAGVVEAFARARGADLALVSGGSSVGERDHVLALLERSGEIVFAGIAVKPGRPTVLALVDGRPVFGMPGNPTSCLTNAYLLVVPLLRRLARLPAAEGRVVRAELARRVSSAPGRRQIYPVRLEGGRAEPVFKGSGDITSLARADGWFDIPADVTSVEAGTPIDVHLFEP